MHFLREKMGGLYRGGQEEGRNGGEGGGKGGERGGGPQGRHLASRWCCREGAVGGWFKVQGGVCVVVSLDFVVQKMLFRYDSRLRFRTRFPYRVFAPLLDTHAALNDAEQQLEICPLTHRCTRSSRRFTQFSGWRSRCATKIGHPEADARHARPCARGAAAHRQLTIAQNERRRIVCTLVDHLSECVKVA